MTGAVAVDFDKVVHLYRGGWRDGQIYDGPVPGAFAGLRTLMGQWPTFIFTSRPPAPVAEWITVHGGIPTVADDGSWEFWEERRELLVTQRKLPALAYLDDRGVWFDGDWDHALAAITAAVDPPGSDTPASPQYPAYSKVAQEKTGATRLWMIVADEGWRTTIVCDGMYEQTADWLVGQLGRRPFVTGR